MNRKHLNDIFNQYIDKFEYFNGGEHEEYYKWQVCHEFPNLMKAALNSKDEDLSEALRAVKKCTYNIIDSQIQPLSGLIEYAKPQNAPGKVRNMLKELYANDGNDLKIRMEKISDFFGRNEELLNTYAKDSFKFAQNSHSVSALLFLNDPDHYYMYKATQSNAFAECVEFYDDWGSGNNIKLDVYYRLCDELIDEIKNSKELLEINESRYDGRLAIHGGDLHPDKEKHILAFDIIWCSMVYNLYGEISYHKRDAKERKHFLANKEKAQNLKQAFDIAKSDFDKLKEVKDFIYGALKVGDEVYNRQNEKGKIITIDKEQNRLTVSYDDKDVKYSLFNALGEPFVEVDKNGVSEYIKEHRTELKQFKAIEERYQNASKDLKPFIEYLD